MVPSGTCRTPAIQQDQSASAKSVGITDLHQCLSTSGMGTSGARDGTNGGTCTTSATQQRGQGANAKKCGNRCKLLCVRLVVKHYILLLD